MPATATLATLPLDAILYISTFLNNPLDALSLSQTCRSTFLAALDSSDFWPRLVPVAHLPRPAPWHSYTPNELREAHVRYAASHRGWKSPSPTFQPPFRLPLPPGLNSDRDFYLRWRSIRGTRWPWSLQRSTGEVNFCDLRTGLEIGKWSAGGWVTDALIESRSPNYWVLCHWKTNWADDTGGTGFEIVATSVTLEQESLTSPITFSFSTIQRTPVEKETSLSSSPMVIWLTSRPGYMDAMGVNQDFQCKKIMIPVQPSSPNQLIKTVHVDVMFMPICQGYQCVIVAQELTGVTEAPVLKKIGAKMVAKFLNEEIVSRYGAIEHTYSLQE